MLPAYLARSDEVEKGASSRPRELSKAVSEAALVCEVKPDVKQQVTQQVKHLGSSDAVEEVRIVDLIVRRRDRHQVEASVVLAYTPIHYECIYAYISSTHITRIIGIYYC